MIFLGVSRGFRIHPYEKTNPLSSSTTYGGPPSPLGKAHEETQQPDNCNLSHFLNITLSLLNSLVSTATNTPAVTRLAATVRMICAGS